LLKPLILTSISISNFDDPQLKLYDSIVMDNAAQVEIQGLIFNSNIVSKQKVIEENVVFGKKDAYGESRAMRRADKVGGINDLNNNFISI
jgi:hypothetical protein